MFSSTKRLIFTLIMGALVLNSCVKEITDDLDDLQTADDIQNWIFPFINSDIQLEDLDSTNLKVYPDGTVYYSSIVDSVMVVEASDIFDLPSTQQISQQPFVFDPVNTRAYTRTSVTTLVSILSNDPAVWSTLSPINGTVATIPSFSTTNVGTYFLPPFQEFTNITYDNGSLDIKISNSSNIPLTNVTLRFENTVGGQDLGTVVFANVPAAGSATEQLDMSGKTIENSIHYDVLTIESPGTTGPVVADFGSPFSVEVSSTDNMAVNNALASFNDPIFDFTFFYELTDDLGVPLSEEITEVKIKSGTLIYYISSDVSAAMRIDGELVGSINSDGQPDSLYAEVIAGPFNFTDSVDLAGTVLDLTGDPINPFNRIPVKFTPSHYFSGPSIHNPFDKTDQINVTLWALNVELEYAKGRFGLDTVAIPTNTIDWEDDDVLGNVSGNVEIEGAKLNFITYTNVGADYSAAVIGAVTDVDGNFLSMNLAQEMEFSGPTIPDFGNTIQDNFIYDNTNSNADELISFLPNTMTTQGVLYVNKNNLNRECYIDEDAFMRVDLEIETPLNFTADTLFFTDTVNYDNEDFEDLKDIDTNKFITNMFLHLDVVNDFPVDIAAVISIIDSVDATTDTLMRVIPYDDVIQGAKVDANGTTIESNVYNHVIPISKDDRLALVDGDRILVRVNLLTSKYNSTSPFVKLKVDDHFKMNLSVEVENHIPVE